MTNRMKELEMKEKGSKSLLANVLDSTKTACGEFTRLGNAPLPGYGSPGGSSPALRNFALLIPHVC